MAASAAHAQNRLFMQRVNAWVRDTKVDLDVVLRKVLFDLAGGVIRRTPVDTGRLKGNWQFSTATPSAPQRDDLDPTPVQVSGGPTERAMALQINEATAGTTHYIVNGLPYAPVIEYGLYGKIPRASGPRGPRGPSTAPRENRAVEREKRATVRTVGGFSTQAPSGMVRVTIAEYQTYVKRAAADVKAGR